MLGLLTSSVSHEMLTPLKCIIQAADKMRKSSKLKHNDSSRSKVRSLRNFVHAQKFSTYTSVWLISSA